MPVDEVPAAPGDAELALERLEAEITELAGHLWAAECRWLALVAEFDRRKGHEAWGCRTAAQWLAWQCGLDRRAAREKVRVARALEQLPTIMARFAAGALSYSKVRALTRIATSAHVRRIAGVRAARRAWPARRRQQQGAHDSAVVAPIGARPRPGLSLSRVWRTDLRRRPPRSPSSPRRTNELANLVQLCWFHHRLVHEGGWNVRLDADGTVRAIRPDGDVLARRRPADGAGSDGAPGGSGRGIRHDNRARASPSTRRRASRGRTASPSTSTTP